MVCKKNIIFQNKIKKDIFMSLINLKFLKLLITKKKISLYIKIFYTYFDFFHPPHVKIKPKILLHFYSLLLSYENLKHN
jgi:hypothetical protein